MYCKNYQQRKDVGEEDSTRRLIGRGVTNTQRYLQLAHFPPCLWCETRPVFIMDDWIISQEELGSPGASKTVKCDGK